MSKLSKRLEKASAEVDKSKSYSVKEAVDVLKKTASVKFDETVDLAVNLGVDPKYNDQMVRGSITLPNGLGKEVRVAVFATGDKLDEAKKAGADVFGADELVAEVKGGRADFDRCIATPDMMPKLGALGKVLGPRGLMPNPKLGTVTQDIAQAVEAAKSGQVEFKVEKNGIVHVGIGKASFDAKALEENIKALVTAVNQAKPTGAKGVYLQKISASTTMGPAVTIDVQDAASAA